MLYEIIRSPQTYTPEAIEAALAELNARQLSVDELAQLNDHWQRGQEKGQKKRNVQILEMKRRLNRFGRNINPFFKEGVEQDLWMIVVSISFFLVYNLLSGFDMILLTINSRMRAPEMMLLLPFVLVPFGLYFFHRKDRLGWIILCAWVGTSIGMLLPHAWRVFTSQQQFAFLREQSPDRLIVLLTFIIFGSYLYALLRLRILRVFRIHTAWAALVVLLSFAFSLLVYFYSR